MSESVPPELPQAKKERFQLYKRFERSDAESNAEFPADEYCDKLRPVPVCTCKVKHAHKCPLKFRKLFNKVRAGNEIDEGIREFKTAYNGPADTRRRPRAVCHAHRRQARKSSPEFFYRYSYPQSFRISAVSSGCCIATKYAASRRSNFIKSFVRISSASATARSNASSC